MEYLNEHDITSNMLKAMRSASRHQNKSVLTEGTNSDEEELTSAELSEEQAAFRDTVSPRVDFTGFKVYPNTKNVIFSGKFENMGGLEWQFTLEDADGLYISADNVPMSEDAITTIKKLKGYYDNWADDWAQKLATEYNRDSSEQEGDTQQSDSV
jgi:hypothetical protein